jgi:hypothetical protein
MAITKLRTVTASSADDEQKIQKPATPEKPAVPATPAKPSKPAEPEEPAEPSKPATACSFDEFISVKPVAPTVVPEQEAVEQAMVSLIQAYKTLIPCPTQEQVAALSIAIGVEISDLCLVLPLSDTPIAVGTQPGGNLNEPGPNQTSFEGDILNPVGETNLDALETPIDIMASAEEADLDEEEDEDFLLPMSTMEDPVYQYHSTKASTTVKSDATPRNTRTGIDDGAPVVEGDDSEQQALINDGVVDLNDEITELNNRSINDDGLS